MTPVANPRLSLLVPEIVALLGGIVSAVIIALPINTFFHFIYFETIVLAPLVEETAKATGVMFLALSYPSALSDKTRGLLLGGLAGLGFAFTENLFYATIPGTDVVARALLPVPMHIMASGIAGMGFVYVAHDRIEPNMCPGNRGPSRFELRNVVSLFVVAVIIHTQFNMLSYFGYSGSVLGLMVASFVYYRLGKMLPEDLQFFTVPGPVKLLSSTVRVRVLKPPFPTVVTPSSRPSPREKNAYCIMCGGEISHGETFCARCGESQV